MTLDSTPGPVSKCREPEPGGGTQGRAMATHLVVVSQDLCEVKRRLSAPIRLELRNQNEMHEIWPSRKMWRFSCLPDGHHGGAGALLDTCEQTPNVVYGIGNNLNELVRESVIKALVFGHRNL